MATEQKKKNLLDSAIDALTTRDEKAAAEAAKKEADAAKVETAKAKAIAEAAEKQNAALRNQMNAIKAKAEADKERQEQLAVQAAAKAAAAKAAAEAPIAKHVWTREDTYASLAQKYYGSFKEPYWRLIYDHNKEIIGDHPNNIRVGLEIEIPQLPEELKKK